MTTNNVFANTLVCAALLVVAMGCTTTRQLTTTSPADLVSSIQVDDVVEVEKRDGNSLEFTVTGVSEEGIDGNGVYVPYAAINNVSLVRHSPLRAGLLVALGVAVVTNPDNE